VNNLYLNNPGKSALANKVNLSVANSGLQANVNILDESQIHLLSKVVPDALSSDIFRYSIFSTVNDGDSINDGIPYRCLTDLAQYAKEPFLPEYYSFNIIHNATVNAYVIAGADKAAYTGHLRYIEAEQRLANQNGLSSKPASYEFKFITVRDVFVEEVAHGRAIFDAATVGTADDEYSQSVYDAFKTALETAEAVSGEAFTNDDLFACGAARALFVRNDGSSEFTTGIENVKPVSVSSDIIISGGNKQIRIASDKPAKVAVYTITGIAVAQKAVSSGESFIPVNPGLYIVRVAGETVKTGKVFVQ
jgi:hypothetical protein